MTKEWRRSLIRELIVVRPGAELTIDTPNASKSLSFRNQSLEDSANLSDPDVIAVEIVEDLEAALQQFAAIAQDLKK